MSFLDQLSSEDRTLLASLPYRVGLYISQSDLSGGDDSDEAEMQALANMITAYAQEVFGAETAQYIISDTVARKDEWPVWSADLHTIEDDCRRAVYLLHGIVDPKELRAFKRCLIEVGESVALAFCEYGDETSVVEKIKIYIAYKQCRFKAAKMGIVAMEWDQFINISLDEREALRTIAYALDMEYL
ncbi:MAG: hypothetical protein ACLFP8_01035 [Alphaproteobacteria bacterium]